MEEKNKKIETEEKEEYTTKVKLNLSLDTETYSILHKCLYYFIQTSSLFEYGEHVETCQNIIDRLNRNAEYEGTEVKTVIYLNTEEYDILHKCLYYYVMTSSMFEYGENIETCHHILYKLNKYVELQK